MAHSSTHLLVFGDQVIDKRPMIRNLVRNSKSSPAARRFLQEATDAVHIELARLTPDEHGWSRNFNSLLELAEEHASYEASDSAVFSITSLMALIGRLGDLIVRTEQDPAVLGSKDRPVHVLALCAGQVAAAAAVAALNLSELFTIARDIISAACRWIRAVNRHRHAMISPNQLGGWCITYPGMDAKRVQAILDEFHVAQNVPKLHKVAIGVVSRSWLTLVGPSSSLRRLAKFSQEIRQAPQIPSDAGVPAHTPFMVGVDADYVLGHTPMLDRTLDWEKVVMVCPNGDCRPRQVGNLRDLLCDIFDDILLRPLLVDSTIESSVAQLDRNISISVHEVGSTTHMPLILKTLAAVGLPYDVVPTYQPPPVCNALTRGMSDLIAIVGMSGRFPGSDNVDEFWHELMAGACHIKKVPESRFDVDTYYDATQKLKNSTAVKDGAWLNDPGLFDNRFFNVSPREAMQMDPVQRLCLTTTHEALEMAGYAPGHTPSMEPERVATYIGVTGYDWQDTMHQQGSDIYYVTGVAKAFISGRINYHYKFGRGAYTLDSVCASSTTAITLACKGLLSRDCDMAVAGGGSVLSAPLAFSGLSRSGMVSLDGGCRTFHDDADGYARGEGIGIVVLKRLEDSIADKDNILGVISGSSRMYSTASTSITHPSHFSQEKIYREVLGQTALDPEEIAYVEMHGTGTQAGDFEELTSILNVMGGQRLENNPLVVGAVKAAMGHGEGAAGVMALIKTLMMLKHRTIPAQPGVPFKLNHRFPLLDKRNVHIALKSTPLRASPRSVDGKIKLLVNTFDASGGNCSLVIQEAPHTGDEKDTRQKDVRTTHVVALSARSTLSLQRNCEKLLEYLEKRPGTNVADLGYTTTARRMHLKLRKAFVCTSTDDLVHQLRQQSIINVKKTDVPRVVFVFTGQGSQYQSMGMTLYKTSTRFREMMDTYQLTALHLGLPQFLPIISGSMDISTASTTQVQLALVALELCMAYMLRSWGIIPDAVVGHSLGEYAALCVAGVLSPSDTLYLVGRRALLMEQHLTPDMHAMLATPLTVPELETCIQNEQVMERMLSCAVACVNSPNATVASGTVSDVLALQDKLACQGISATLLRVRFGFHSAQVDPVLREFEQIACGIVFKKPVVPVASTLTGQLVDTDGIFGPRYLARQAREPVNFVRALHAAEAVSSCSKNTTLWIEAGPDAVCLGMVHQTLKVDAAYLLPALKSRKVGWETAAKVLKVAYENGVAVDWKAYHSEFSDNLSLLSDLPAYTWDYKHYWAPYSVAPAWKIEETLTAAKSGDNARTKHAQHVASGFAPTMSLGSLIEETLDTLAGTMTAVFSSDTLTPGLRTAIEGHVVNGHTVMPLAVFCDMALSSAKHCHFRVVPSSNLVNTQMRLQDMVIEKAIVLTAGSNPIVLTTASYSRATGSVDITFHHEGEKGSLGPLAGKCRVTITASAAPESLTSEQTQAMFLVKSRMQQLRDLAAAGKAHTLLQPVVYKLFGNFVQYSPEYRSMDQVILSIDSQDALVSLTAPIENEAAANCTLNPFVYDGVNQIVGFLVNNSLRSSDDQIIYISEGFGESRQWAPLVPGRKYTTYASAQDMDASGTSVAAICYVFDAEDGHLVEMVTGIQFRKMKKAVLDHVLGVTNPAARKDFTSIPTVHVQALDYAPSPTAEAFHFTEHRGAVLHSAGRSIMPKTTLAAPESDTVQPMSLINDLLAVVAAEVGISSEDLTDETGFRDLGVDSLMAITVLAKIRNELGFDLPPAFFLDYDTVGALKQALSRQSQHERPRYNLTPLPGSPIEGHDSVPQLTPHYGSDQSEVSSVTTQDDNEDEEPKVAFAIAEVPSMTVFEIPDEEKIQPNCKIVHLQGHPQQQSSNSEPTVFLLADDTGSAVGYVQLPNLGGPCVYGVNWPTGIDIDQTGLIASLADAMAASIAAHPAPQPYILGGVGFGAVLAMEVASRMPAKDIAGVILLDPPGVGDPVPVQVKPPLLRPAQMSKVNAAAKAMQGYKWEGRGSSMATPLILVVPKFRKGLDTRSGWLAGADVRPVEGAQAGELLRFPQIIITGQICQKIIEEIKG